MSDYMEQSSRFDTTRESKKAIWLSIATVTIILFLLLLIFALSRRNTTTYCMLSESNNCENEVTEIVGTINSSYPYPDLGYVFTPNKNYITIPNTIYVKNLSFIAYNLKSNNAKEYLNHTIPFGSEVVVKGTIMNIDKQRCINKDYAYKNPSVCTKEGFRLLISPDIIHSVSEKQINYSILGKFPNINDIKTSCPKTTQLCGLEAKNSCYEIVLENKVCTNIQNTSNMFLTKGTTDNLEKPLSPSQMFQVTSISYSGTPVNPETSNLLNKYYANVNKKISVFDGSGTKLITI